MGKVPKPLTILLTDEEMLQWEVFQKMASQGHVITSLENTLMNLGYPLPHLILGSKAAFMTKGMEKYVPIAVKAARTRAYPNKKIATGGDDD